MEHQPEVSQRSDIILLEILLSRLFQMKSSLCSLITFLVFKKTFTETEGSRLITILEEFRPEIGKQGYYFKPYEKHPREQFLKSIIKTLRTEQLSIDWRSYEIGVLVTTFYLTKEISNKDFNRYIKLCDKYNEKYDKYIIRYAVKYLNHNKE